MNKLVGICAALLLAVVCSLAYDFEDDDFNQLLSAELEEIYDSLDEVPTHPRARRDEEAAAANEEKCKKRHRRPKLCCAESTLDALHDNEKELCRACYKEVTGVEKFNRHESGHHHRKFDLFSCEQVERRKTDMICIHQCIGRKKGVLAEDGSLIPEKLTEFLKQSFANESWFDQAVDKIVLTCAAAAKNATENPAKFYTDGLKSCNPSGIALKHCIFRELQLSCPADQIKDKVSCDKFQERIKKGMEFFDKEGPGFDAADASAEDH
ncbi:uncharacterized protein [Euwallacea fornicatus]|uniref:uncharacterized protein n=1 Tax=Euwallacea fornicatus TaxID=995702 RepID=UPI00338E2205